MAEGLVCRVEYGHIVVDDYCFAELERTSVMGVDGDRDVDRDLLKSVQEAHNARLYGKRGTNHLYQMNVGFMKSFFKVKKWIELKCPKCGGEYRITKKDFPSVDWDDDFSSRIGR